LEGHKRNPLVSLLLAGLSLLAGLGTALVGVLAAPPGDGDEDDEGGRGRAPAAPPSPTTPVAAAPGRARQPAPALRFQEQASQIILVMLIAYGIEAGAIRWRDRPVNGTLSLMTVAMLLAGEVFALIDLATDDPAHADVIAGSMAAG
jgi:hypothetical protein